VIRWFGERGKARRLSRCPLPLPDHVAQIDARDPSGVAFAYCYGYSRPSSTRSCPGRVTCAADSGRPRTSATCVFAARNTTNFALSCSKETGRRRIMLFFRAQDGICGPAKPPDCTLQTTNSDRGSNECGDPITTEFDRLKNREKRVQPSTSKGGSMPGKNARSPVRPRAPKRSGAAGPSQGSPETPPTRVTRSPRRRGRGSTRDLDADRLGHSDVDHQLELGRLLGRCVAGVRPFQHLVG
jgi:hypothetical protein